MARQKVLCPHGVVGKDSCRDCKKNYDRLWKQRNPDYFRAYYKRQRAEKGYKPRPARMSKEEYAIKRKVKMKRYAALCYAFISWLKTGLVCVDCAQRYPEVMMEFDHLPNYEKKATISALAGRGWTKQLLEELPKTELVCKACHHNRTQQRRKEAGMQVLGY
jgi:hypothetical protein